LLTEYKLESKTSIGSALLLYNSTTSPLPPTLPPTLQYNESTQLTCYYPTTTRTAGCNTGAVTGSDCRISGSRKRSRRVPCKIPHGGG